MSQKGGLNNTTWHDELSWGTEGEPIGLNVYWLKRALQSCRRAVRSSLVPFKLPAVSEANTISAVTGKHVGCEAANINREVADDQVLNSLLLEKNSSGYHIHSELSILSSSWGLFAGSPMVHDRYVFSLICQAILLLANQHTIYRRDG